TPTSAPPTLLHFASTTLPEPRPERAAVNPANGGLAEEAGPPPSTTSPLGKHPLQHARRPIPVAQPRRPHAPTTDRVDWRKHAHPQLAPRLGRWICMSNTAPT